MPEICVKSDGRSNAKLIADMLLEEAIEKGNIQAAREIFDRVEGKAKQAVDLIVKKSEIEMYEGIIAELIKRAKSRGYNLSREKAIKYLAIYDARILEIDEPTDRKIH